MDEPSPAAVSRPDPWIGVRLADRYEIVARLGEGGMGTVYKARQEPVGRPVAVKLLAPQHGEDERTLQRFRNEARIVGQLRNPHTVGLIDFGTTQPGGGSLFITLEYVAGGNLRERLAGGRLAPSIAVRVAGQVAGSLAEAHALGVVHRDLKPENILLDDVHGERVFARVTDFGLAKLLPDATAVEEGLGGIDLTRPGTRLGTPAYMSPEQAFGKPLDGRADLYAVGVLLHEMLTGRPPFHSEQGTGLYMALLHQSPPRVSAAVPELAADPELDALVLTLLAKDPGQRPPDADTVVAVLDRIRRRLEESEAPGRAAGWVLPAAPERVEDEPEAPMPARPWLLPTVAAAAGAVGFVLGSLLGRA